MIIGILIAVAIVVAVFAAFVASRPSTFLISRSLLIPAPASVLFAEVNDLHHWEAWSPWARLDPNARNTHEGAASGVGAIFHWAGNAKVGSGSMTIIESEPDQLVRIRLEFLKPFKATNLVDFTFQPQDQGTLVTWRMTGTNNFVVKAVGMFMNCDQMIGGMYEQGLANLKQVVEEMAMTH